MTVTMAGEMRFDVVVVGGGHAGTEAAAVAARMGARTLLLTHKLATVGEMSCNPSIGGVGKGHLVREVDALDGIMARAADLAGIHYKMLNRSRGLAVRGPRVQADRALYRAAVQALLAEQPNLTLREAAVDDLALTADGSVTGVICANGERILCGAVVLTTGTFLGGVIHVGHERHSAGRIREAASIKLAGRLRALNLPMGRLKTGTPPRLGRKGIAWESLEPDHGDVDPEPMSFMTTSVVNPQVECRITRTTAATHEIVRNNIHLSAVHGGAISGKGPRYCPSIEDKVVRFADKDRHQVFLEPEGLTSDIVYPNGVSTSLPEYVQRAMIGSMPGLQSAIIVRAGYAIEYDYVDPRALRPSLELRAIPGLFLAGQINGTTGYEEAAGQGVVAGINAARLASGCAPIVLDRSCSYIGVMIDDLTTQGVSEPYRMFTSRAEFRLTLRADNADLRLGPVGAGIGCLSRARVALFQSHETDVANALAWCSSDLRAVSDLGLACIPIKADGQRRGVLDLIAGGAEMSRIESIFHWMRPLSRRAKQQLQAHALYRGYLPRQDAEARQLQGSDAVRVPDEVDYGTVNGLGAEMRARLMAAKPVSFGALTRIPGLTPSAIIAVMSHVRRGVKLPSSVSRET